MRKSILFLSVLFFITGCEDNHTIDTPVIKKGKVVAKDYIPRKLEPVLNVGNLESRAGSHFVQSSTTELYLVTIQEIKIRPDGCKDYNSSIYQVSNTVFGETEIGTIFDSQADPLTKLAEIR